jgi:malate dehydrogenase (quinone)
VSDDESAECDVLLVGEGIMSATVATLLAELDPSLRIEIFERLDRVAGESTDAWNNAGTGHAALCELNYTPEKDGRVEAAKAVKVMEAFERSKQLWGHLAEHGELGPPEAFVRSVPHLSFVGEADVGFLRRRHEALTAYPLFRGMEFSDDRARLAAWMPLVMDGRGPGQVAATRSTLGTDVDFGALTRGLFQHLSRRFGLAPWLGHEVTRIDRAADGRWLVETASESLGLTRTFRARFVFLGAGGGALELLADSEIEKAAGYGGFPVSGEWLVCTNEALVARHAAKVYGKAAVGTPPMSVPHLDSRVIEGRRALLFGPFAGFSTKFLKEGSYLDLPGSISLTNLLPMLGAGLANLPLTQYLVSEVTKSFDERVEALRAFVPTARADDWERRVAGQRVQIIKRDETTFGRLEFGTEIVSAKDDTLAALLGASPGASTSVQVALDLLADCFPAQLASPSWQAKLRAMIPAWDQPPSAAQRDRSHAQLGLLPP